MLVGLAAACSVVQLVATRLLYVLCVQLLDVIPLGSNEHVVFEGLLGCTTLECMHGLNKRLQALLIAQHNRILVQLVLIVVRVAFVHLCCEFEILERAVNFAYGEEATSTLVNSKGA